MDLDEATREFRAFVDIIKALRTPGTGCPWDLEQTHQTLRPYLIEEAYEVLDAIDRGSDGSLQEELGDLLLQVVLHAQVADDRSAFSITEVIRGIAAKMIRRHPHVFASTQVSGAAEVVRNWEQIKAAESQDKGEMPSPESAFARIPKSLPALLRAQEVGKQAARMGAGDEPPAEILAQTRQELTALEDELRAANVSPEEHRARLDHEIGDLLFSICQLARRLGLSAEDGLRASTKRFVENRAERDDG
jgi:MazG family protein